MAADFMAGHEVEPLDRFAYAELEIRGPLSLDRFAHAELEIRGPLLLERFAYAELEIRGPLSLERCAHAETVIRGLAFCFRETSFSIKLLLSFCKACL